MEHIFHNTLNGRLRYMSHVSRIHLLIFFSVLFTSAATLAGPRGISSASSCIENSGNFESEANVGNEVCRASCDMLSASDDEIVEILKNLLKPRIKKLLRPISFFHYGERGSFIRGGQQYSNFPSTDNPEDFTGPIDIEPRPAKKYFQDMTANFFDRPQPEMLDTFFGKALYAAVDPLASIRYLGNPGFLLTITAPKGTTYYDTRIGSPKLTEEHSRLIGCKFESWSGEKNKNVARSITKNRRFSISLLVSTTEGQALLKKVFRDLEISFIISTFLADSGYIECKNTANTMAVFVDSGSADRLKIQAFVPAMDENPSPEKLSAYREILEYFDIFTCKGSTNKLLCPDGWQRKYFWKMYAGIAPKVHQLDPRVNLLEFQSEEAARQTKRRQELTQKAFGCSRDPRFASEAK